MKKAILKTYNYSSYCDLKGERELREDSISLTYEGKEISYTAVADDPEDMIFGRSLEETDSIKEMILLAHELGKQGVEIEVAEEIEG